ncbi:MAG: EamA family transporter, partial [Planctomycetes bacterium]|nr:EamA family transporter [Planctomycetota bacterium]
MRAAFTNTADPSKVLMILAFAAIYVLWGSTFLAIRYTVETLPPFLMAGIRAFVAGLILFGFVGVPRLRTLTWAHWRSAIISGGLFFLGCHGLLFRMEKTIDSGVAALFLATIPGWMVILSCLTGQTVMTARTLVGLLLGLVGVALLVLQTG